MGEHQTGSVFEETPFLVCVFHSPRRHKHILGCIFSGTFLPLWKKDNKCYFPTSCPILGTETSFLDFLLQQRNTNFPHFLRRNHITREESMAVAFIRTAVALLVTATGQ